MMSVHPKLVRMPASNLRMEFPDPSDHIAKRIITRREWYERDLLDDIRKRIAPDQLAIDVGAHIGNHALFLAGVCGARVLAFEPNPSSREALERNVRLNGLRGRVKILAAAVGERAGRAKVVNDEPWNSGMARAVLDPDGDVAVKSLDDLHIDDVAVIKIDVEGAEMSVLSGAIETLRRSKPVLYIETGDPEAVDAFLRPFGYERFGQFAITPTYGYAVRPRISVAVMAHPSRREFVEDLLTRLDRPATVVWDERNDRWDTGRRSWLAYDPDATHHLVIQDDAVPCRDLVAGLERAIEILKDDVPLCLYAGKMQQFRNEVGRKAGGASWLVLDQMEWGVGIVMPVRFIPEMIEWCDRLDLANYDMRMSDWLVARGIKVWYPWPSLLDHRDAPSLVPGRKAGRHALRFIGADTSALDHHWTREHVAMRFRRSFPA